MSIRALILAIMNWAIACGRTGPSFCNFLFLKSACNSAISKVPRKRTIPITPTSKQSRIYSRYKLTLRSTVSPKTLLLGLNEGRRRTSKTTTRVAMSWQLWMPNDVSTGDERRCIKHIPAQYTDTRKKRRLESYVVALRRFSGKHRVRNLPS